MKPAANTKIFGIRLGVDPKLLLGGLAVLAVALLWYNLQSEGQDSGYPAVSQIVRSQASIQTTAKARAHAQSRRGETELRAALKYRTVDGSRGNIDPRLRLDLLDRLSRTPEPGRSRSIFEVASIPAPEIAAPRIEPQAAPPVIPVSMPVVTPAPAPVAIPLKYFGFLKSTGPGKDRRGFFLDGSDVVIGAQGDILEQRYRLVSLNASSAQLEDLETKSAQVLSAPAEINQ